MNDFFLFEPQDDKNIPTAVYGSAAMVLADGGNLPSWALFVYKDLKEAANGAAPSLLAYICEDAMILAPVHNGSMVRGMVIAKHKASGQRRTMTSPCGRTIYTEIPVGNGQVFAKEDVEIPLIS